MSLKGIPTICSQESALLLVTLVWGGTFALIQHALGMSGPLFFVGLRFLCAAIAMTLLSLRILRGLNRTELLAGLGIGCCLFLAYGLQTYGLQRISSSTSAFITAAYVPMVPLLHWLMSGRRPQLRVWIGVGFAFTGLLVLATPSAWGGGNGTGELQTLGSALAIALQIVLISLFAPRVSVLRVTVVQLATTSTLAFLSMPLMSEPVPELTWPLVGVSGGLGLVSAAIIFTMNWAQRRVSPSRATVIYATEPVWAGLIGWLLGEQFSFLTLVGAALIITGVLASSHRTPVKTPDRAPVTGETGR